jgi:DNA-binding LacI/PurR family transcriptional regulator
VESGKELAKRILQAEKLPTAVVAMNDMVAFGILRHFLQEKIRVPEDISVLGFDDSVYCELSSPALTTVKVQSEQMGRMAAMLLLDDIRDGGSSAVGLSLEPVIIQRDSVSDCREEPTADFS